MLNHDFRLSSTWDLFTTECERLKLMFSKLMYPDSLINSTIAHFVTSVMLRDTLSTPQTENIHWIVLPIKKTEVNCHSKETSLCLKQQN